MCSCEYGKFFFPENDDLCVCLSMFATEFFLGSAVARIWDKSDYSEAAMNNDLAWDDL